jgi:c-di-GMP-related signal transduction protein
MASTKIALAASVEESAGNPHIEYEFVYLARQPILDRDGALAAFELLFRNSSENRAFVTDDQEATAHVLVRTIGDVGIAAALGQHMGYVNISRDMLMSEVILLIPPHRFVLEILETVSLDAEALARCSKLRQYGYKVALDDVTEISERFLDAIPITDIVKIDFLECDRDSMLEIVGLAKKHRKLLLAEKVETDVDYRLALQLGFDLFQGYYFAKPQVLTSRRASSSRQALLRLLGLLATDPTLAELEGELKLSPNLVVQVLRLINSSAFGLSRPISSLRQAIIAIGTRQIARWAQLLFFADGRNLSLQSDPLVQLAGARARFMELAALSLRPGDDKLADAGFITGIFSLVHIVFGATVEEIVEMLRLSPAIRAAILEHTGELGLLLALAKAAEIGDEATLLAACEALKIKFPEVIEFDLHHVGELNLAAAAWITEHAHS